MCFCGWVWFVFFVGVELGGACSYGMGLFCGWVGVVWLGFVGGGGVWVVVGGGGWGVCVAIYIVDCNLTSESFVPCCARSCGWLSGGTEGGNEFFVNNLPDGGLIGECSLESVNFFRR